MRLVCSLLYGSLTARGVYLISLSRKGVDILVPTKPPRYFLPQDMISTSNYFPRLLWLHFSCLNQRFLPTLFCPHLRYRLIYHEACLPRTSYSVGTYKAGLRNIGCGSTQFKISSPFLHVVKISSSPFFRVLCSSSRLIFHRVRP
jgi:hypothetical protein